MSAKASIHTPPDGYGGRSLPDPYETPTVTVPRAAVLLGISRTAAYAGANRGEIPTLRVGQRLLVPTVGLYRILGHPLPSKGD